MSNWKVVDADDLDGKLSAIGDAIRGKTNKTDMIPVQNMASEISSIKTVGGILSIKVPSGTKCVISKGATSYTSTATSSGVATFLGIEDGVWNIRCESGSSYGTSQVTVKLGYEVSVPMIGPELYFNGNEYTQLTGGWVGYTYNGKKTSVGGDSNTTVIKYSNYIMIWGAGAFGTNNRIDFRSFKKLYITYNLSSSSEISGVRFPGVHIYDNKNADVYSNSGIRNLTLGPTYGSDKTVSVDISGLGGGYIAFSGHTHDYFFEIKKVYLGF